MTFWNRLAHLVLLAPAGCAMLAGQQAAFSSCSFEQVWDNSVAALGDFQLQSADKTAGTLETNWMEVEASTRAGIFEREVNKERLKYLVDVKRDGAGAAATVLQRREAWTPMGVRMRQWRTIPGNPSEEQAVAAEIARRLKEKGC